MKIKQGVLETPMDKTARSLSIPYVATIGHIESDPHSGFDMYIFEGCRWGWYENEVESLYFEDASIESRFELMIFD